MGAIIEKTVTQIIYVSSDKKETVLTEMNDAHLVNAFGQACNNLSESDFPLTVLKSKNRKLVDALRAEILRRLSLCKSSNEN